MSFTENRFETSEVKTRKKHKIVLTTDSPNSSELSASQVVHVAPNEKAIEAKEQRAKEREERRIAEAEEQKRREIEEQAAKRAAVAAQRAARDAEEKAKAAEAAAAASESTASSAMKKEDEIDYSTYKAVPLEEMQAQRRKKRFKLSLTQKKALSGWIFVLPFVIGILFIYAPIVYNSIVISLSDIELVQGGMNLTWNNFANYKYLFAADGDPYFSITIVDGIKDLLLQIPAIVIFALFMAIILNQKMTGRAAFRAIFFLPVILSTGIIDAIDTNSAFMNAIANSQGGVDDNTGAAESGGIISAMDIEQLLGGIKIGTGLVDYVVGLVNDIFDIVSRSGVQMLIFLSGLQSISPSIYESCEVEGASAWETFWKITLPMISPMILVNAIYTVIDAFTAADNRVMIYIEKIYSHLEYAHSSAMSWVYVGVVLLFIVLVALIMKTVVFYQKRD